jgi:D-alanine-D-alanine ligase
LGRPHFHHGSGWRLAVLAGGDSAEREISLQSGEAVARALSEGGHEVTVIDPWRQPVEAVDWSPFDAAFIALHGTYGEDGQVQQELDAQGVRYTGSDAAASRRAFHKAVAKTVFEAWDLPTPESRIVGPRSTEGDLEAAAGELGFPLVVKPEAQGSSIGISLVESAAGLSEAVALAGGYGEFILLERAIPGEEWTVPLIDDELLTPIRIRTPHEFFDFSAKYEDDQTGYELIDPASDAVARSVGEVSRHACRALGTRGVCRVDLRVDPAGRPWLLEVNTVPGFTDHSLVPKSASHCGWSMAELCQRAIESVLRESCRPGIFSEPPW